jgi:DNA-directed RNA polymerase subunit K
MVEKQKFSKYERARILGARGLQISMDAPILLKIDKKELEGTNYDPLIIAEKELDSGVLPITVNRPLPARGKEGEIKKIKIEESTVSDEKKIKSEQEEEKEIAESGEMMGLTNSDGEDSEEKISAPAPIADLE